MALHVGSKKPCRPNDVDCLSEITSVSLAEVPPLPFAIFSAGLTAAEILDERINKGCPSSEIAAVHSGQKCLTWVIHWRTL
jgi:hypothetical protein